jgi:hypothetical protein
MSGARNPLGTSTASIAYPESDCVMFTEPETTSSPKKSAWPVTSILRVFAWTDGAAEMPYIAKNDA